MYLHDSSRGQRAEHARSVREDTAELADYQLTDQADRSNPSFLGRPRSRSILTGRESPAPESDVDDAEAAGSSEDYRRGFRTIVP